MNKSEELNKQLSEEDNDLKALGIYTKILREERLERFEHYIPQLILKGFNITDFESQGKVTIEPTKFGIIDYYPKANKILIRKDNNWIKPGLQWMITNLLK